MMHGVETIILVYFIIEVFFYSTPNENLNIKRGKKSSKNLSYKIFVATAG